MGSCFSMTKERCSSASDCRKKFIEKKQNPSTELEEAQQTVAKMSTEVDKMNVAMSKFADSANGTATKVSFQEVRMVHGSRGHSVSACMRQIRNAFDEWDVGRSETHMIGILDGELTKYVNSTGGRAESSDEVWRYTI